MICNQTTKVEKMDFFSQYDMKRKRNFFLG